MQARKPTTLADYRERVARVQRHLEAHLDEALDLAEASRLASFSPYHFHRIFRAVTGESLAQAQRRLRLERAAARLRSGAGDILTLALEAGYESHEAFTRAFRRAYACTPSAFREDRRHVSPPPSPVAPPEPKGNMEIRTIEVLEALCLRHVGPYDQVGPVWERLCEYAGRNDLFGPDTRLFGASYDDPELTPPDKLRYEACLSVAPSTPDQGEFLRRSHGGGRYAVLLHEGPYERLGDSYQRLFADIVASDRHEPRHAPCLEFYLNDPETTDPEDLLTEICVPIDD